MDLKHSKGFWPHRMVHKEQWDLPIIPMASYCLVGGVGGRNGASRVSHGPTMGDDQCIPGGTRMRTKRCHEIALVVTPKIHLQTIDIPRHPTSGKKTAATAWKVAAHYIIRWYNYCMLHVPKAFPTTRINSEKSLWSQRRNSCLCQAVRQSTRLGRNIWRIAIHMMYLGCHALPETVESLKHLKTFKSLHTVSRSQLWNLEYRKWKEEGGKQFEISSSTTLSHCHIDPKSVQRCPKQRWNGQIRHPRPHRARKRLEIAPVVASSASGPGRSVSRSHAKSYAEHRKQRDKNTDKEVPELGCWMYMNMILILIN